MKKLQTKKLQRVLPICSRCKGTQIIDAGRFLCPVCDAAFLTGSAEPRRPALVAEEPPAPEPATDFHALIARMLAGITPATAAEAAASRDKSRVQPLLRDAGISAEHLRDLSTAGGPWAAALAKARAQLAAEPGAIVALIGPRGTGKTQLIAQLFRDYILRTVDAEDAYQAAVAAQPFGSGKKIDANVPTYQLHYTKAARFFGRMKELFANVGTINAETRQAELDCLARYDLVAIDELQEAAEDTENRRVGFTKILTDFVDLRYSAQRPTILISNHYDRANPTDRKSAETFLGSSIVSRMNQTGGFLVCDWRSFRER